MTMSMHLAPFRQCISEIYSSATQRVAPSNFYSFVSGAHKENFEIITITTIHYSAGATPEWFCLAALCRAVARPHVPHHAAFRRRSLAASGRDPSPSLSASQARAGPEYRPKLARLHEKEKPAESPAGNSVRPRLPFAPASLPPQTPSPLRRGPSLH